MILARNILFQLCDIRVMHHLDESGRITRCGAAPIFAPTARMPTSTAPPAGKGTTTRTGLDGYDWANNESAANAKTTKTPTPDKLV